MQAPHFSPPSARDSHFGDQYHHGNERDVQPQGAQQQYQGFAYGPDRGRSSAQAWQPHADAEPRQYDARHEAGRGQAAYNQGARRSNDSREYRRESGEAAGAAALADRGEAARMTAAALQKLNYRSVLPYDHPHPAAVGPPGGMRGREGGRGHAALLAHEKPMHHKRDCNEYGVYALVATCAAVAARLTTSFHCRTSPVVLEYDGSALQTCLWTTCILDLSFSLCMPCIMWMQAFGPALAVDCPRQTCQHNSVASRHADANTSVCWSFVDNLNQSIMGDDVLHQKSGHP